MLLSPCSTVLCGGPDSLMFLSKWVNPLSCPCLSHPHLLLYPLTSGNVLISLFLFKNTLFYTHTKHLKIQKLELSTLFSFIYIYTIPKSSAVYFLDFDFSQCPDHINLVMACTINRKKSNINHIDLLLKGGSIFQHLDFTPHVPT